MAEELGSNHAWLVDHLVDTDGPPENGCLEGWTLLAAIAARTTRIRLGVLVSSNTFRHPAFLLKEAVTVDHISDGRLILGIGTGWNEDEHRRYGIDLPVPRERVDRFEEAIQVISLLMSQERIRCPSSQFRRAPGSSFPRRSAEVDRWIRANTRIGHLTLGARSGVPDIPARSTVSGMLRRAVGPDDAGESGAHFSDESGAHRGRPNTNHGRLITGRA